MNHLRKKIVLGSVAAVVAVGIGMVLYVTVLAPRDLAALESYSRVGDAHEDAAFLVGMAENPVRFELDRVLADVLMRPMEDAERRSLAVRGKELLKVLETQIDAIGVKEEESARALDVLSSSPLALSDITNVGEVVRLGTIRAQLIADIRGLSYRANYHTAQIFDRILAEEGALSAEHVASLNDDLPQVEEQFDRRSNLYVELEGVSLDMRKSLEVLK